MFEQQGNYLSSDRGEILNPVKKERPLRLGLYTSTGLAVDETAMNETAANYQLAFNLYNQTGQGMGIEIVGVAGSFANGRPRLGIYHSQNFAEVEQGEIANKIAMRNGMNADAEHSINVFPSDLDIVIRSHNADVTNLQANLARLTESIFQETGVLVQDLSALGAQNYVPTQEVLNDGLIKRVRDLITQGNITQPTINSHDRTELVKIHLSNMYQDAMSILETGDKQAAEKLRQYATQLAEQYSLELPGGYSILEKLIREN